jgi:hypothetical protein
MGFTLAAVAAAQMRGEPALDHCALAHWEGHGRRCGCERASPGAVTAGRPQRTREGELCAGAVVGGSCLVERDRALEKCDGSACIAQTELGLAEAREVVGLLGFRKATDRRDRQCVARR